MDCSDVIWQRGLLRKGYGICHGTSGNGYSFLSLYHLTQDKKYLYRACKVRTPLSLQLWNFPGQSPTAWLLFPLWACPSQSVVESVSSVTSLSLVLCPHLWDEGSKHKGYSEDQKFRDYTAWSELLYCIVYVFVFEESELAQMGFGFAVPKDDHELWSSCCSPSQVLGLQIFDVIPNLYTTLLS